MVRAYINPGLDADSRTFWLGFGLSAACHLILFSALVFLPKLKPKRTFFPSVINVSMVSLSDLGMAPGSTAPTPSTPADIQVSKPSTTSSKASQEWKTKKSLKKQTYKPSEVAKDVVDRIEKKVEEKPPERLIEAMDRIQDEVAKTRPVDRPVDTAVRDAPQQEAGEPGVPGVSAGTGSSGKRDLELIDIYRALIAADIQRNWAFSPLLAKGQTDLETLIAFKVMPNGEIRDIQFDKRSGNHYLDESAQKAIIKSNPVRPHPQGINKPYIMVGLRATPKGFK